MKVEIENYRGWSISFDTEKENFYCHSEQWDRDENKKSYASTKKWIDDFIKENETFKPFFIETMPEFYDSYKCVKLIGIRKDGRFIYEDEKGEKRQLSEYKENNYILYNSENDKYKIELKKVDAEIEKFRLKRNEIINKFVSVELKEFKKQFIK